MIEQNKNDKAERKEENSIKTAENTKKKQKTALKNVHFGHRQRLKNRFLKSGLDDFEPHNILELILFYAQPQLDVNDTAHALINKFGSLSGVLNAEFSQLIDVKGVKEHTATLIKLFPAVALESYKDMIKKAAKDAVHGYDMLEDYIQRLFAGKNRESLWMFCLDDSFNLCFSEELKTGNLNDISAEIRPIAENALRLGYKNVVLAHNHPSGSALPSIEDIDATRRIKSILEIFGIELYEHFVVSKTRCIGILNWGKTK